MGQSVFYDPIHPIHIHGGVTGTIELYFEGIKIQILSQISERACK